MVLSSSTIGKFAHSVSFYLGHSVYRFTIITFLLITTYLKLLSLKSYNNCSYKKLILSRVKSLRMETRRNRNTNKRLVEYNRKTYSQRKVEVVEDAMVVVVVDVVDVVDVVVEL